MTSLNLKHLRYFQVVANEGSIARAAEVLHLTPQTISGQLRELEDNIGSKLFQKDGRGLTLTDTGRLALSYADEIFRLKGELEHVLEGGSAGSLRVGIAMVVPKLIAYRILAPALEMPESVRLSCHEAPLVDLLGELSAHKLDLVLADSPLSPELNVRAYNHHLGASGTSFFAAHPAADRLRSGFPHSLTDAPFLMPSRGAALRSNLENWLERLGIVPNVIAEFDDRALMKAFGEAGVGAFTSPTAVEEDVSRKYGVEVIGRVGELAEHFYAITLERRIHHPAVSVVTEAARRRLFC